MVAYSFKGQFADAVAAGRKLQTIRAPRRNGHAKPGDKLQLYAGMRTKSCRKLADGICIMSTYCAIREDGVTLGGDQQFDLDQFAKDDGFCTFEEMKDFFRGEHGLPFVGQVIRWRLAE